MQGTGEIFIRNIKERDSMSNRETAAELPEQIPNNSARSITGFALFLCGLFAYNAAKRLDKLLKPHSYVIFRSRTNNIAF